MSIDFIIPRQHSNTQDNSVYMMCARQSEIDSKYKSLNDASEINFSFSSFYIDRLYLDKITRYSTILECLNEADTVEFEQPPEKTIFELNALSSRIAKESRRGRGNILLSHPYSLKSSFFTEKTMQGFNIILDTRLKENEFYMMHRGVSEYDVPIVRCGIANDTFVLNPMFKTLVKRFKLPY